MLQLFFEHLCARNEARHISEQIVTRISAFRFFYSLIIIVSQHVAQQEAIDVKSALETLTG